MRFIKREYVDPGVLALQKSLIEEIAGWKAESVFYPDRSEDDDDEWVFPQPKPPPPPPPDPEPKPNRGGRPQKRRIGSRPWQAAGFAYKADWIAAGCPHRK